MLRTEQNLTGNDRFEGFCIDMIRNIANIIGFQYKIRLSPSKVYGIKDPETGEWNGLVRELIDNVSIGLYINNYKWRFRNCCRS